MASPIPVIGGGFGSGSDDDDESASATAAAAADDVDDFPAFASGESSAEDDGRHMLDDGHHHHQQAHAQAQLPEGVPETAWQRVERSTIALASFLLIVGVLGILVGISTMNIGAIIVGGIALVPGGYKSCELWQAYSQHKTLLSYRGAVAGGQAYEMVHHTAAEGAQQEEEGVQGGSAV